MMGRHGPDATAGWYRVAGKLGTRLYMPASVLILITGILLVLQVDAYGFGTRFVTVGFAMIIIGAVLGIVVFEPGSEKVAAAIEAGDQGGIRQAVTRIAGFGAFDTLLLLLTIAAMVVRWS